MLRSFQLLRRPLLASSSNSWLLASATAARPYVTRTRPVALPIKAVEVLKLSDDNEDTTKATKGILVSTPMLQGSLVQAGDIVAVIETLDGDAAAKVEIPSPCTGRLVELVRDVDDTVHLGDVVVKIDTDAVEAAHSSQSPEQLEAASKLPPIVQDMLQHIQDHHGDLQEEFLQTKLVQNECSLQSKNYEPVRRC
jgi:biotin carboxyl carrier protein